MHTHIYAYTYVYMHTTLALSLSSLLDSRFADSETPLPFWEEAGLAPSLSILGHAIGENLRPFVPGLSFPRSLLRSLVLPSRRRYTRRASAHSGVTKMVLSAGGEWNWWRYRVTEELSITSVFVLRNSLELLSVAGIISDKRCYFLQQCPTVPEIIFDRLVCIKLRV